MYLMSTNMVIRSVVMLLTFNTISPAMLSEDNFGRDKSVNYDFDPFEYNESPSKFRLYKLFKLNNSSKQSVLKQKETLQESGRRFYSGMDGVVIGGAANSESQPRQNAPSPNVAAPKVDVMAVTKGDQSNIPAQDGSGDKYCRSFRSCEGCIRSMQYHCDWCHDFGCTNDPYTLCPNAKKSPFPRSSVSPNSTSTCPYISHPGPILLHVGEMKIKVKINVYDPIMYKKEIFCMIRLSMNIKETFIVPAEIVGDQVYCEPIFYPKSQYKSGVLQLYWGGLAHLSNVLPIMMYDCEKAGKDCGACSKIPPKYECGWCHKQNRCLHRDRCYGFYKWTNSGALKCERIPKLGNSYFPLE